MFGLRRKITYSDASAQIASGIVPDAILQLREANPLAVDDGDVNKPLSPAQIQEISVFDLFAFLRGVVAAMSDQTQASRFTQALIEGFGKELVSNNAFDNLSTFRQMCATRFDTHDRSLRTGHEPKNALMSLSEAALIACGETSRDIVLMMTLSARYVDHGAAARRLVEKFLHGYKFVEA